jgi:hypothetical protein
VQHVHEIEEKPLEKLRQIEHGERERERERERESEAVALTLVAGAVCVI